MYFGGDSGVRVGMTGKGARVTLAVQALPAPRPPLHQTPLSLHPCLVYYPPSLTPPHSHTPLTPYTTSPPHGAQKDNPSSHIDGHELLCGGFLNWRRRRSTFVTLGDVCDVRDVMGGGPQASVPPFYPSATYRNLVFLLLLHQVISHSL